MSWKDFRQTILLFADNPASIPDRNTVAKLYANAYHNAIKTGGDSINKTRLINGNVESMRQRFLDALEKGVRTHGPYDLVAEMGAGVKAYWTNATLDKLPIPIQLPEGAVSNINIVENKVEYVGDWLKPLPTPSAPNQTNATQPAKENPKPADDYNLRKMLDDAGYAAIKKYEDTKGCVSLISGKTGLAITDWKQAGCSIGYKPGQDAQEGIIKERIKNVLGFDVWAKIPPVFRMQIYSFMYNADSNASGDLFRWIAGLLQAAKNETSQYRTNVRTNKTIRDVELPYLKGLTTVDFQKIYPKYLKVLDEMYQAISNAELQSVANKKTNSEKAASVKLGAAYNLTWKDRPKEIENYYNADASKKDKSPQEVEQTPTKLTQTTEQPKSETPLQSGPIPPTTDTSLFVDYFIRTAVNHLSTLRGKMLVQANYGATNGPGVINWTGYTVELGFSEGNVDTDDRDRFDELKKAGIDVKEDDVQNDADEFGGDADDVLTTYKGKATKEQILAIQKAGKAVHHIGTYIDYSILNPKTKKLGAEVNTVGFNTGRCARWTYNWAKNYVNILRGKPTSNGPAYAAGGDANANRGIPSRQGYWKSLELLGYTKAVDKVISKKELIDQLKSDKFDLGDVVVYWGIDLPEGTSSKGLSSYNLGHTQIFTGGYQSYTKAALGTKAPSGKGSYTTLWDKGNHWETDAYNNYGANMVYTNPKKGPSTTWRFILFKAPTK